MGLSSIDHVPGRWGFPDRGSTMIGQIQSIWDQVAVYSRPGKHAGVAGFSMKLDALAGKRQENRIIW